MPRKMRRAALRSALSVKAADEAIVLLDEMKVTEAKTRPMAESLDKLVGESSVLILIPAKTAEYDLIARSVNNLPYAKTIMAQYLDIRDLLSFDKVLMPVETLDVLETYLG
jgi:large subunit ribosomal protein L4